MLLLDLFSAEDVALSIAPVAFALCSDDVSAVRTSAFHVLSGILKKFTDIGDAQQPISFVNDVIDRFAHSNKWKMRQ